MELSSILPFLKNRTILITGATGFLAKIYIEKILRVQPNVKKLYLLLRAGDTKSALNRFNNEIPADMVVNAMIAAMVVHADEPGTHIIYHVGSSMANPVSYSSLQEFGFHYFTKNPWTSKDGKPVIVVKATQEIGFPMTKTSRNDDGDKGLQVVIGDKSVTFLTWHVQDEPDNESSSNLVTHSFSD
ncbi:unnamed protein product [Fraxinus pennsylvanica]|uniref:Fatty acyl-CoA reductase n=1 Tax=Fraxinus pennsylvanica TaxID=56036 RepID=A0AAD1ZRI4_9LAMI|nr:unnamed protein product [Fraxinus pennsylvanica]